MSSRKKACATNWLVGFFLLWGAATQVMASASFTLINLDSPGEGFNGLTPVAPVSGNMGTTIGAQRVNAFNAALQVWGNSLNSDIPIKVEARFDPLTCASNSGILGSAAPNSAHGNFPGGMPNTWYGSALANSIAGNDLSSTSSDIQATFNSNLDSSPD